MSWLGSTQTKAQISQVESLGQNNPTWKDKFAFKVNTNEMLKNQSLTQLVFELYFVQPLWNDRLIGTARILLGNMGSYSNRYYEGMKGTFRTFQDCLPCGEQGILNIGIIVWDI